MTATPNLTTANANSPDGIPRKAPMTHQDVFSIALYARAESYEKVIAAIAENGGEITEALGLELAAVEDAFDVKAERCALFVKNLQAIAKAAEEEASRLADLARVRRNTAESLKGYIMREMQRLGKEKIERPLAKLSIVNNGGNPAIRWHGEIEHVPEPYRTTKTVYGINHAKVLEAYADERPLPEGLTVERGQNLRIT